DSTRRAGSRSRGTCRRGTSRFVRLGIADGPAGTPALLRSGAGLRAGPTGVQVGRAFGRGGTRGRALFFFRQSSPRIAAMNLLEATPAEAIAFFRARGLDALAARRALTAAVREGPAAIAR